MKWNIIVLTIIVAFLYNVRPARDTSQIVKTNKIRDALIICEERTQINLTIRNANNPVTMLSTLNTLCPDKYKELMNENK